MSRGSLGTERKVAAVAETMTAILPPRAGRQSLGHSPDTQDAPLNVSDPRLIPTSGPEQSASKAPSVTNPRKRLVLGVTQKHCMGTSTQYLRSGD